MLDFFYFQPRLTQKKAGDGLLRRRFLWSLFVISVITTARATIARRTTTKIAEIARRTATHARAVRIYYDIATAIATNTLKSRIPEIPPATATASVSAVVLTTASASAVVLTTATAIHAGIASTRITTATAIRAKIASTRITTAGRNRSIHSARITYIPHSISKPLVYLRRTSYYIL